jgi:hypothetical protein
LPVPSNVTLDLSGSYDGSTHAGSISITLHNVGSSSLSGRVYCVLTESQLYYLAPNGLDWHHHVMRDMMPTETGTAVTVAPGEQTVVTLPFQLQAAWVEEECELICFFQDIVFQPNNTLEIWQGAKVSISELPGMAGVHEEPVNRVQAEPTAVLYPAQPNPGHPATEITFELQQGCDVRLGIYDPAGRRVTTLLEGVQAPGRHTVTWTGLTDAGAEAQSGLYFCRLEAGPAQQILRLLITR